MVGLSQLTPTQKFLLAVSLPITFIFLYFLFRKNDDEEDDDTKHSVVTSKHVSLEVLVPRHAVGAVIGLQGSQIKQIQELTRTRINFRGESQKDEDRMLVIRGRQDAVHQAELLVRKVIVDQPPIVSDTISVPGNTIGRIIGRNGDTIRSLTRQSKAKIVIDKPDKRSETLPVVIGLTGTEAAIDTAKMLILEKVSEDKEFREKDRLKKESQRRERIAADNAGGGEMSADAGTEAGGVYRLVYLSAVEHPEHFWMQMLSERSTQLDVLISEMTSFYETQGEPLTDVRPGEVVAAPFDSDNSWYRAEVWSVEDDTVNLYYGDFGDTCVVQKDRIRRLRSDFQSLPFQAVECCLANVKPVDGRHWTESAIDAFEELTHTAKWKPLRSKTVGQRADDNGFQMPCVHLVDTNGPTDIDIAAQLVQLGHAAYVGHAAEGGHMAESPVVTRDTQVNEDTQ